MTPARKPATQKDVILLASFLSDPNPATVQLAQRQLKALLQKNPQCRQWLESSRDHDTARAALNFLEGIRRESLESDFRQLARQGDDLNLEKGAWLLACSAFPQLTEGQISDPLDRLAESFQAMKDAEPASPEDDIRRLRKFLFSQQGFHGNRDNYYDPDNSFLNRVLERRTGIPISLSCVYLLLAARVGVAAHGIGLPGHFIVGHTVAGRPLWVDPYHQGRWLTRRDCIDIVRQRGIAFREEFLHPTPHRQILVRMIVNLVNLYSEQNAPDQAQWLSRIVSFFEAQ